MLSQFGYQVTSKTSSTNALTLFNSDPDAFDLVITDMTMPEMTGAQMAAKMLTVRPDIPVIICTGFSKKISACRVRGVKHDPNAWAGRLGPWWEGGIGPSGSDPHAVPLPAPRRWPIR